MKKIKILLISAIGYLLLAGNHCTAQPFKLIKATSQSWAGGVVGHYGTNYFIELESTSKTLIPDTVWIDGQVYALNFSVKDGTAISTVDSVTHKIKYFIRESEAHNQYASPNRNTDMATEKPKPVRQFDGAAMVSYMQKHKERFFIIQSFIRLQQLNYP